MNTIKIDNNPATNVTTTANVTPTVEWQGHSYRLVTVTKAEEGAGASACDFCVFAGCGECDNVPCGTIDQYLAPVKGVAALCDAIMESKRAQDEAGEECWDEAADDLAANAPIGNENAEGWLGEDQESAEAFAESLERDALRGFPLANDARALAEKAAWVALDGKWRDLGDQIRKGAETGDTWTEFCLYLSPISEIRPNLLEEFDSRLKLFGYRFKHRPSSSDAGTEVYQISW